jgi:Skp family chaperone for outer membrane proteins|tara:strand:- start:304 stop:825 length:522 start_codon:yes stop_codon:yes gene_type:complete
MKFLLSIIISIFLLFINTANSEQNIAFIDMDRVISTSKAGSSILKQLTNINKKNMIFLTNEEKKFKESEAKLISQKNIISETDLQTKIDNLKSKINIYNKDRTKMIEDFNKLKVENTNKLLTLINPILVRFSNEKKFSIILQKKDLIIGKTELDITDAIIKIINNEIKEFKIK